VTLPLLKVSSAFISCCVSYRVSPHDSVGLPLPTHGTDEARVPPLHRPRRLAYVYRPTILMNCGTRSNDGRFHKESISFISSAICVSPNSATCVTAQCVINKQRNPNSAMCNQQHNMCISLVGLGVAMSIRLSIVAAAAAFWTGQDSDAWPARVVRRGPEGRGY
jgi:hypothetical protein